DERPEDTLERPWQVAKDYPVFGVGLGNFREVTRQVYKDDFFRPPHNSYLWAICEGGIFVLAAYLWLFWVTWQDLRHVRRYAYKDPEFEIWAAAIRIVFLLFFFYSAFADLWLNPLCYVLIGLVICMRQYVDTTLISQSERVPEPRSARLAGPAAACASGSPCLRPCSEPVGRSAISSRCSPCSIPHASPSRSSRCGRAGRSRMSSGRAA